MAFVHPDFLWALLVVSIPVMIHLFNFTRYKKVYFSNVRFLKAVQLETKSRSRLREILILLFRCLFLTALVLAFAQPIWPMEKNQTQLASKQVSLYIDNSFSMENVSTRGPLLQVAIQEARDLASAVNPDTRFQLLTNDFEGRHQRLYSREDFIRLLDEVHISPAPRRLSEVLARQTLFLQGTGAADKRIYLFSDLQANAVDLSNFLPDSAMHYTFVPLRANKVNNVAVDTCWFETPMQQKGFIQNLHVRLRNYGDEAIDLGTARLILNNQQTAIASYSLQALAQTELLFSFENNVSGSTQGSVRIQDYPVGFDDELFFTFDSRIFIQVVLINGKNAGRQFSTLLRNDSLFRATIMDEQMINYAAFKKADVIVLNELENLSSGLLAELRNFEEKGGVLLIVPPRSLGSEDYRQAIANFGLPIPGIKDTSAQRTEQLQYASSFFAGVFEKQEEKMNMPLVNLHFRLPQQAGDAEVLMRLQKGDPYFIAGRKGLLRSFFITSPLDERSTNFQKHALFVPILYKVCFGSLPQRPLFHLAGTNAIIAWRMDSLGKDQPPHIVSADGKIDLIPEVRRSAGEHQLNTRGEITKPGFYTLNLGQSSKSPLAFNYSRQESDLRTLSTQELQQMIDGRGWQNVSLLDSAAGTIGKAAALDTEGRRLWKLFLILALIFLATEVSLLRLLK